MTKGGVRFVKEEVALGRPDLSGEFPTGTFSVWSARGRVHVLVPAEYFVVVTADDFKTLTVLRNGDVYLDETHIGYVVRNAQRLYEAFLASGRVVSTNADCKATAVGRLGRASGALALGDVYRIAGIPSATGGPWTVA